MREADVFWIKFHRQRKRLGKVLYLKQNQIKQSREARKRIVFQFLTDFSGLTSAFDKANEDTPSGTFICLYSSEIRKYHLVTRVKKNGNLGGSLTMVTRGISDMFVALEKTLLHTFSMVVS